MVLLVLVKVPSAFSTGVLPITTRALVASPTMPNRFWPEGSALKLKSRLDPAATPKPARVTASSGFAVTGWLRGSYCAMLMLALVKVWFGSMKSANTMWLSASTPRTMRLPSTGSANSEMAPPSMALRPLGAPPVATPP